MEFTEKFRDHICIGDRITTTVGSYRITARIRRDLDYDIDHDDVHNPKVHPANEFPKIHRQIMEAREAYDRDEWWYGVLILSVSFNGVELDDYAVVLGGLEINYPGSNNEHITEAANELLREARDVGRVARGRMVEKLTA